MLTIREMTDDDRDAVLVMARSFYESPACDHEVPEEILERNFAAACSREELCLRGFLLLDGEALAGYCYCVRAYATEAGGGCVWIEDLYLRPECRGKGYGTAVVEHIAALYADCRRIRLEVTPSNERAAALYQKLGFEYLTYRQMVWDRL